jgi:hypothetical protein
MVILIAPIPIFQSGSVLAGSSKAVDKTGDEPAGGAVERSVDEITIASAIAKLRDVEKGAVSTRAALYDNGSLVNSPGSGPGGADQSVLQGSLAMGIIGFGHQYALGNRIADDFEVTDGKWTVNQIHLFSYQTGSPVDPSPITGVYMQIWDGPPSEPTSKVVWGDLTTNRLTSSAWSGIFRVTDTTLGSTTRPIMRNVLDVEVSLKRGIYWLDWTVDGSLPSGQWAPPITISGQGATGNALQYLPSSWDNVEDNGLQQGFPFILYGNSFSWVLMNPAITNGRVR